MDLKSPDIPMFSSEQLAKLDALFPPGDLVWGGKFYAHELKDFVLSGIQSRALRNEIRPYSHRFRPQSVCTSMIPDVSTWQARYKAYTHEGPTSNRTENYDSIGIVIDRTKVLTHFPQQVFANRRIIQR